MSRRSNAKSETQTEPAQHKRRLFYFGPGLLIALILAVIIGGNSVKNEMQRRQANKMPPIIERQVVSSDRDQLGPVPEVKFLLDRKTKLALSEDQARKLKQLQSDWEKYSVPRIKQADEAAKQVGNYMSRAEGNKRTPTAQIQKEAAPVVAISSEISTQRKTYWSRAMQVLSPEQRKLADSERKTDYTAKRKALAEALDDK